MHVHYQVFKICVIPGRCANKSHIVYMIFFLFCHYSACCFLWYFSAILCTFSMREWDKKFYFFFFLSYDHTNISQSNGIKWHTHRHKHHTGETISSEWNPLWKMKSSCFHLHAFMLIFFVVVVVVSLSLSIFFFCCFDWMVFVHWCCKRTNRVALFSRVVRNDWGNVRTTSSIHSHCDHSINRPLLESLFIVRTSSLVFFSFLFCCCCWFYFVSLFAEQMKINKNLWQRIFIGKFGLNYFDFSLSHLKHM